MFDGLETKRVPRADLSSSPEPQLATVTAPIYLDLEFVDASGRIDDDEDAETDLELDFPLFSGAAPQRMTLRSPTPAPAEGELWDAVAHSRKRPLEHFILCAADLDARRKEFAEVLVTGIDVLRGAKKPWPATAARCEWKVTHIPADAAVKVETGKRKKPGKKRRIKIRIAKKEEKEKEERRRKSQAGREKFKGLTPEEREKAANKERIHKNRVKKLKRRAREKAKKAASVGGVSGNGNKSNGDAHEVMGEDAN